MTAPVQDLPVETGIRAVTPLSPLLQVPASPLTGWPPAKLGQLPTSPFVPHLKLTSDPNLSVEDGKFHSMTTTETNWILRVLSAYTININGEPYLELPSLDINARYVRGNMPNDT